MDPIAKEYFIEIKKLKVLVSLVEELIDITDDYNVFDEFVSEYYGHFLSAYSLRDKFTIDDLKNYKL